MHSFNNSLEVNFQEEGFTIIDHPLIPSPMIDAAQSQIEQIKQGIFDTGLSPTGMMNIQDPMGVQRITHIHAANEAFYNLVTQTKLGEVAAKILNTDKVKVWGSQLYIKPPHSGQSGHVGWHCDAQHMPYLQGDLIIAWIAFDEVTLASGCLQYVKNSHLPNAFATPLGGGFQDLDSEAKRLAASNLHKPWETVPVCLPKGGVSFHHWNLVHGSGSNQTDQVRIGLSVGLASENFKILENIPDYGLSHIIDHPMYCPVIYDETTTKPSSYVHHER